MKTSSIILYLILVLLNVSCSKKTQTSERLNYPLIEKVGTDTMFFETEKFSFQYSDAAHIVPVEAKNKNGLWFNIIYPSYKATIFCSYIPIDKKSLKGVLEDNYKLVYSHTIQADRITAKTFENGLNRVYGTIYDIEGRVAVPLQFFVTDSTSNFIRGSVYYDNIVNPDSVVSVTAYLREDIVTLIESMYWKK